MKSLARKDLSAAAKERIQRRLSRYIRSVAHRNNLQFKLLAADLGMAPAKFSELIHPSKPYGPFIHAIEYLHGLAALDKDLGLPQFVKLLEGKGSQGEKSELKKWEQRIIKAFSLVPVDMIDEFLADVERSDKSRIEAMVNHLLFLRCASAAEIEALTTAMSSLVAKRRP